MTGASTSIATRERVLAFILGHIEQRGEPPMVKTTGRAVGLSCRNVKAATAALVKEGRLAAEHSSYMVFAAKRAEAIAIRVAKGEQKRAIASDMKIARGSVYRSLSRFHCQSLTTAG